MRDAEARGLIQCPAPFASAAAAKEDASAAMPFVFGNLREGEEGGGGVLSCCLPYPLNH